MASENLASIMTTQSKLLSLPFELRSRIWHFVLHQPCGIILQFNWDLWGKDYHDADRAERCHWLRAIDPVPVQIMRVNHQVYSECIQTFYRSNVIKFECGPVNANMFLESLPSVHRKSLRYFIYG